MRRYLKGKKLDESSAGTRVDTDPPVLVQHKGMGN